MKIFQFFIIVLAFTSAFVISTDAQTEQSQSINLGKVAVINFELIKNEETGIKEFIDIRKKLEVEFKPQQSELKLLVEKARKLQREFEQSFIQIKLTPKGGCFISIEKTSDEYEKIIAELKQKQEQAKLHYQKRYSEETVPIDKKIAEALKQFAKNKGYDIIIDNVVVEKGIITDIENDVTEEFIQFYNNQTEKK